MSAAVAAVLVTAAAAAAGVAVRAWDWRRENRTSSRQDAAAVAVAEIQDDAAFRADLLERIRRLEAAAERREREYLELYRLHAALEIKHERLKRDHELVKAELDQTRAAAGAESR